MILGLSSLILMSNALCNNKNYPKNVATIFTIALFLFNSMFIVQNTAEHIAANRVDENVGATINALIEKYEKENNIKVTKFGYKYDYQPQQFSVGIRPMQSMTERKIACTWSILYAMDYYCNRKFEHVEFKMPDTNQSSISYKTDYKEFSEEQLFFDGDTIYMIVY